MKVFLTGAAGLIGLETGNALADAGWDVVAIDLRPAAGARFHILVADLLRKDDWASRLAGCDVVVHLAGHADAGRVPDEQLLAENNALNERVFAEATRAGVRRILFASSCQVSSGMLAGPDPRERLPLLYLPLDGEAPARPRNVYARSKAEAETRLREWAQGDAGRSAIAVRFPWVMPGDMVEEAMWYRTALRSERDAFSFLTASEAGRFIAKAAAADLTGYRCYYPACAENLLLWPAERVRRRFLADTALRQPAPLASLVDLDVLARDLNWTPRPLPQFRGVAGAWRTLRVLGWQAVSRRMPTARRRLRELMGRFGAVRSNAGPEIGTARRVGGAEAQFGESPVWQAESGSVFWVDLGTPRVLCTDVGTGETREYDAGEATSAVGLLAGEKGFWVARRHDVVCLRFDPGSSSGPAPVPAFTGRATLSAALAAGECGAFSARLEGAPNRLNDGKVDPAGRLWVGSMHMEGRAPTGAVFCLHPNGRTERKLEGLICPNGPAFSPDGRLMYLVNSAERRLEAYELDPESGALGSARTIIVFPSPIGVPDGVCVDREGMLWIALFGGGKVVRVDPRQGKMVGHIRLPHRAVTSCTLGGRDLRTLFVTTAAGSDRSPGGLFAAEVHVAGFSANQFRCSPGP